MLGIKSITTTTNITSAPEYTDDAEELHIPVPWGHIAAKWWGRRDVRPILGIHGWQDNAGTFDRLAPLLPPNVGLLAIDFPGHGLSSPLPPGMFYDKMMYVHVISLLQKEYNWKKISIMGHSMGAIIGFMYTSLFPDEVDMMIALDGLKLFYLTPDIFVPLTKSLIKGMIIENERTHSAVEPPSYFYSELVDKLHDGMFGAIDKNHAHHLLRRGCRKSDLYPDKFYFIRDGRTKLLNVFTFDKELCFEMAKNIKSPYLFLTTPHSSELNREDPEYSAEFLSYMIENVKTFEVHQVEGKHHVHLNEPKKVIGLVTDFINKHRPPGKDEDIFQKAKL